MKECTRCKVLKELDEFGNDQSTKDKKKYYCKICVKELKLDWQKNNPDKHKEGAKRRNKRYYEKYPEQRKESNKKWGEKNPDKLREKTKRYRLNHPDRIIESALKGKIKKAIQSKVYREKNKEKLRAIGREYYKNNREKLLEQSKAYYKTEKGKHTSFMNQMKRNKRSKSLPHKYTFDDWQRCKNYFIECCSVCSNQVELHKDHWIAISNPDCPGTITTNIVPLCKSCNSSKNNIKAETWLQRNYPETYQEILDKIYKYFGTLTKE